jgi:ubiquitin-protein ligase
MMMEIWRDPLCARSLDAIASSQVPKERLLFVDFCSAVLNDLVYLLKDALGRLEDIAHLEKSMADRPAWTAAPRQQREDKLRFYASQQRAATGFLSQAVTTLDMLNTLVASSAVQTGFVSPEVVSKSAGAAFHFIDLMVGPCCAALRDLRTPERYGFDPDALLLGVVTFTLRLAEHASFRGAMAHVPDYDGDVLSRAFDTLSEKQLGSYEHRTRLEALQASVDAKKEPRDEALVIVVNCGKAVDSDEIAVDAATLEAEYVAVLGPLAVGEFDAALPRAYNRHFAQMAEAGTGGGDSGQTAKRLAREMRDLRGKMTLPVHAAGAVYVRHDAHRLDIIRACVTGPEGTPYEGGLFFFDVFAPSGYPQIPPLLELETTGGGVARFNPNLYADGKVCLSLLGTWHGGAASEKWNPATSSLWQVFLSIQGMILVPEPYFNEPAYEGMRGTPEGEAASLRYNFEVQV